MRDVFVCDAVRTPIGRFGGSLAKVRADDLAAVPIKALMARHPKLDWAAGRRSLFRLRQPGRRGQPQRGADGAVAGGPAGIGSRPHAQPSLRLRARCGRCGRPRDPRRRDRFCHCRRRRIDDAGAVRDGQGAGSVFALGRHFRHHHRLALHQSADEGAIRRRCDARDRRERRRGIPGVARRSGRVRDPLAAARRCGDRVGLFCRGNHAGVGARRQGRPDHGRQGRASAPRNHARRPDKAEADRAQSRHGDGGQCLRRQ